MKNLIKRLISIILSIILMIPINYIPVTAEEINLKEVSKSGFNLNIEWSDPNFKDNSNYNLTEPLNTSNVVPLRVSSCYHR